MSLVLNNWARNRSICCPANVNTIMWSQTNIFVLFFLFFVSKGKFIDFTLIAWTDGLLQNNVDPNQTLQSFVLHCLPLIQQILDTMIHNGLVQTLKKEVKELSRPII